MRRASFNIVWTLVIAILTTSCATLQPTASYISDADYNQRIIVENPQYKKKRSAIGYVFEFGMPVVGGVAGYIVDPYIKQTADGQESSHVGSVLLGALVGTGISYVSNVVGKYGSLKSADNKQAWVNKAFGDKYLLLNASDSRIRIINTVAEQNYIVKNIGDVEDFAKAFPNSLNSEKIVVKALSELRRNDLPHVLELYPNTEHAQKLKNRYINESPTFEELTEALKKYPKPDSEVEGLYASVVSTPQNAIDFHSKYPNSKMNKTVVINAFRTTASTADVRKLSTTYGKTFNLTQTDLSRASDKIRENYYIGIRDMGTYKNMSQLDAFNNKYAWLTFKNKKRELANKAWKLANSLYPKGRDVIAQAGKIVTQSYAKKAGLDGNYFNGFVNDMLKEEIKNVSIVSTEWQSSTSEEYERWKKSIYAAGIVKKEGGLQFLIYGQVKNPTKFDMPVELIVTADCIYKVSIVDEGLIGKGLNFLGKLTGTPMPEKNIGRLTITDYTMPSLMAGQTMPYAILLAIGEEQTGVREAGINFADLFKATSEVRLNNIQITPVITDRKPTKEQLTKQNEWLKMAVNGMPNVKAVDWFRNQEYHQSSWDAEWARILRESKNRSYSSSYSSREKDVDNDDDKEEEEEEEEEKEYEVSVDIENIPMPEYEWIGDWEEDTVLPLGYGGKTGWEHRDILFSDPDVGKAWISRSVDKKRYNITSGTGYTNLDDVIKAQYVLFKYNKKRETGRIW